MSDDKIKAILSHEFGHLAHHDTETLLIVLIGNAVVYLFFLIFRTIWRILSWIFSFLASLSAGSFWGAFWRGVVLFGTRIIIDRFLNACYFAWTYLGVIICNAGGRSDEYNADIYACECGYGHALAAFLQYVDSKEGRKRTAGVAAALQATHPASGKRIERIHIWLQENGMLNLK